jgi:hypothetical protein
VGVRSATASRKQMLPCQPANVFIYKFGDKFQAAWTTLFVRQDKKA